MEDKYVNPINRRQHVHIPNQRYYEIFYFNIILNMQIQEFIDRLSEVSSKLVICMYDDSK